ncbi:MAG: enolase C-terminal domain-like protein [Sphingobacterium sp.]
MDRRKFIGHCALLWAYSATSETKGGEVKMTDRKLAISKVRSDFEKEELRFPFGFKGAFLTELWQTIAVVESVNGAYGLGLGTQSVLYGDAEAFASTSETNGNQWMYRLTGRALDWLVGRSFDSPIDAIDELVPWLHQEGKQLTSREDLHVNFVYNALVSVDNALWMLYAQENKVTSFKDMIPTPYRAAFNAQNEKIAVMFQVSYNMPLSDIQEAVHQGYFVFKIKTGSPGDQKTMLKQDKARLKAIHEVIRTSVPSNQQQKIHYTMDANGRYHAKETVVDYLQYAKEIGAFDHILLYEEPFVEQNQEDVSDLGVTVAADESIHSEADALRKIALGYRAFVLKGIAKTLSLTVKIAKIAQEHEIPCLCSDLTVNPILIDWNKMIAATLPPFPELGMGMMETNGDMNYTNWEAMKRKHPFAGAPWTTIQHGMFHLDPSFFQHLGGITTASEFYKRKMELG